MGTQTFFTLLTIGLVFLQNLGVEGALPTIQNVAIDTDSITDTSARVTFTMLGYRYPVFGLMVFYWPTNTTQDPMGNTASYFDDDYTMYRLKPNTYYTVGIRCIDSNTFAYGPWSKKVTFKTKGELAQVNNISVTSKQTTATISWDKVTDSDVTKLAMEYYTPGGYVLRSSKTITKDKTQIEIYGLKHSTIYKVRMRTLGEKYNGNWGEPVVFETKQPEGDTFKFGKGISKDEIKVGLTKTIYDCVDKCKFEKFKGQPVNGVSIAMEGCGLTCLCHKKMTGRSKDKKYLSSYIQ